VDQVDYDAIVTSEDGPQSQGARQFGVLAAFVVAGLLVCGVATELTLRVAGRVPNVFKPGPNFGAEGLFTLDPTTGWVNKPGRYQAFEPGNAWLTVTETGLRGTGLPIPSNGREFLIVGASCTQGYGVEDHETFTHGLSKRYSRFAFPNLASGGYSSVQSHLATSRYFDGLGDRPPPALVIYGFVGRVAGWNVASVAWIHQVINETGEYIVPPHVERDGDDWASIQEAS
jgi:hypothetical protein